MTNSTENHWYNDIGHTFTRLICQGIYFVLAGVYNILIQIAGEPIVGSASVAKFFGRVQLIIGLFMMFRISISILQAIINPDALTDAKNGTGGIIIKIIVALTMLTLLVPIKAPVAKSKMNSFEKQVSANGLLFGTLYDFQQRVLDQNILAKLVLGVEKQGKDTTKDTGDKLSSIILKSFFTPNLKAGKDNNFKMKKEDGVYKFQHKDLFCLVYSDQKGFGLPQIDGSDDYDEVRKAYKTYYKSNDTTELLNMINQGCESAEIDIGGWDAYAFNFNWFPALIVGLLFLIVLVMLCIEVAKRAIKLAILRLIAPIPIISYMGPGSDFKSGPMGAWIKLLGTTYAELFINLLVIYFAMFIIEQVSTSDTLSFSGSAGLFAKIFIYLGLILFAKDAPKFLKKALGVNEDTGSGLFSGLAKVAGAGATGAKKLGAGVATAAAGEGFKTGWNAVHGNGKAHQLSEAWKNMTPKRQERRQQELEAKQNRKQYDRDKKEGEALYNKLGNDPNNPNYNAVYDNPEFIDSLKQMDAADAELASANKAFSRMDKPKEGDSAAKWERYEKAQKRVSDAQKKVDGAKAYHKRMCGLYTDDAKKKEKIDMYKESLASGGSSSSGYTATRSGGNRSSGSGSSSSSGSSGGSGSSSGSNRELNFNPGGNSHTNSDSNLAGQINDRMGIQDKSSEQRHTEHQQREGELKELFHGSAGSNYLDANEKYNDEHGPNQN